MGKKQATKTLALLTLMPLLFLASCSTKDIFVGDVYEHDNIQKLTEGMTEQEVISILGAEPSTRTILKNDNCLLQWYYTHASLGKAVSRHVAILFSSDNKMIKITSTTQSGKEF